MGTPLTTGRSWRAAVTLVVFAALGITCGATRTEAVIAIIRSTGVFSLGPDQGTTAHVVNTGSERGFIINWKVVNQAGDVLARSDNRPLALGHEDSFDFTPERQAVQRLPIRVVLTVVDRSRMPFDHPGFIATQEIFNTANGRTTIVLPYLEQ